jgi:hypothetical protein
MTYNMSLNSRNVYRNKPFSMSRDVSQGPHDRELQYPEYSSKIGSTAEIGVLGPRLKRNDDKK